VDDCTNVVEHILPRFYARTDISAIVSDAWRSPARPSTAIHCLWWPDVVVANGR